MSENVEKLFESVIKASNNIKRVNNKTSRNIFSSIATKESSSSQKKKIKASNMSTTGSSLISTVTNTKGHGWFKSIFSSNATKESSEKNRENNINIKISKIK